MLEIIGGLGLVGTMLTLFRINHDKIEKTRDSFHKVDKDLAVLMTILEIKWGKGIIEEARKKNGNKDNH